MEKNKLTIMFVMLLVVGLISTAGGATYAYFAGTTTTNESDMTGKTYELNAGIKIENRASGKLIPMQDALISNALASQNICTDSRGYYACNLFKITLENEGISQSFNGFIVTNSGTTLASNDLKYQLYTLSNGTYTAVSDVKAITNGVENYFTLSNSNITFNLPDGRTSKYSTDYYLAVWLSDTNEDQPLVQDKKMDATVKFVSTLGDQIAASFTTS